MDFGNGLVAFGTLISVAVFASREARSNARDPERKPRSRGTPVAS